MKDDGGGQYEAITRKKYTVKKQEKMRERERLPNKGKTGRKKVY